MLPRIFSFIFKSYMAVLQANLLSTFNFSNYFLNYTITRCCCCEMWPKHNLSNSKCIDHLFYAEETDTEKPDGKKQTKNVKVNDSAANENSSDSQLQVEVGVGSVASDMVASDFWDEERGSVTESEYKKLVKDADVEDYLRGELCFFRVYLHDP